MKTIKKLNYSETTLELIFQFLKLSRESGHTRAYKMIVDGIEIVPLTKVLSWFNFYKQFVKSQPGYLRVVIYKNGFYESDYVFTFSKPEPKLNRFLSGLKSFFPKLRRMKQRSELVKLLERVKKTEVVELGDTLLVAIPKAEMQKHFSMLEKFDFITHLRDFMGFSTDDRIAHP